MDRRLDSARVVAALAWMVIGSTGAVRIHAGEVLSCDDLVASSLEPQTSEDYRFSGERGDVVSLMLVKQGGISSFTPVFDLFVEDTEAGSKKPIVTGERGVREVELPATGDYSLRVRAVGTTRNDYFLGLRWLWPLWRCDVPELAPDAPPVESAIGDAHQHVYSVSMAAGDSLSLELLAIGGEPRFAPALDVYLEGQAVDRVEAGGGVSEVEALEGGDYAIRIRQQLVRDRNDAYLNLHGRYSLRVVALERAPRRFVRGDANADREIDLADAITILATLFSGDDSMSCERSGDVNASGSLDITDPIHLLQFLFLTGSEPSSPFPDCGPPLPQDTVGCKSFGPCF